MKACGCRNHKGGQKQMHKSQDAALRQLCQAVYECPRKPGVWHVATARTT